MPGKKYHRADSANDRVMLVRDPKSRTLVACYGNDYGTPERARHNLGLRIADRTISRSGLVVGRGAVANGDTFVDRLFFTGRLGFDAELKRRRSAVDWVRSTFERAKYRQRMGGSYEPPTSKGPSEMDDRTVAAREDFHAMWQALGLRHANLIEDCVCWDIECHPESINQLGVALDKVARWRGFS